MPRILLIEDNPANLELMNYLLGSFGYSAQTATDGVSGLAAALSRPFDLIVCDIHIPQMDGYEVARRLKADPAARAVPLVAVTAMAMVGDREKVLDAGFEGYITKPIDPETFVRQIETFIKPDLRKIIAVPDIPAAAIQQFPEVQHIVLTVDDQPINLQLVRGILEPNGYRVVSAESVEAALAWARENQCDLFLCEVCMNAGSGYDLIRSVKADVKLRDKPFVFITNTQEEEQHRALAHSLGADRILVRPIEPGALLTEIESCLRKAKTRL